MSGLTLTIFTFAFQPFYLYVLAQNARSLALPFVTTGMLGVIAQVFWLEPLSARYNLVTILRAALMARGMLLFCVPVFPNLAAFWVLMVGLGIVNSFPKPLTMSIVSLKSSDREQGEILGINTAYLSLSNAFGPAIAGLLTGFNYQVSFLVAGILMLLAAILASRIDC